MNWNYTIAFVITLTIIVWFGIIFKKNWTKRKLISVLVKRTPVPDDVFAQSFEFELSPVALKVRELLGKELAISREFIRKEDHLVDDLGIDLAYNDSRLMLVLSIEREFGVKISDDFANSLTTLESLVSYVYLRLKSIK